MATKHTRRIDQLGVDYSTASGRLKKIIFFSYIQRCNDDICFRCGRKIESVEEFSLDHKLAWMDSDDPVGLFFDVSNIAFSHLKCNSDARRKSRQSTKSTGKTSKYIGVYYYNDKRSRRKRWRASISVNGVQKHLGYFLTESEASVAYQDALRMTI